MCVNVIQLFFQFLINNNKWVREHYSAHCALMKRFDSRALILMHLRLSPLKKSMSWANSVLQRYPKMLLFFFSCSKHCDNLAGAERNLWFNTASGGQSLYTHGYRAPAVQSRADAAVKKKKGKVHYLYLLNTHGCPYWAAVIQESSTLIRIMWLIN